MNAIENCNNCVFYGEQPQGASLGIAEGTHLDDVTVANLETTGDLTVGDDLTVTGDYIAQAGFGTFITAGTFANATNTLACVANPFSATSTIDFVGIYMTGYATTTHSIVTATSTYSTGLSTSTTYIASPVTSGMIYATNVTGTAWVSLQSGVIAANFPPILSYAISKMLVKPNEYVCIVTGEGDGGYTTGVTNTANTFAGTYKIRWSR